METVTRGFSASKSSKRWWWGFQNCSESSDDNSGEDPSEDMFPVFEEPKVSINPFVSSWGDVDVNTAESTLSDMFEVN